MLSCLIDGMGKASVSYVLSSTCAPISTPSHLGKYYAVRLQLRRGVHAMDCWVAQLGVVTHQHLQIAESKRSKAPARVGRPSPVWCLPVPATAFIRHRRVTSRAAYRALELALPSARREFAASARVGRTSTAWPLTLPRPRSTARRVISRAACRAVELARPSAHWDSRPRPRWQRGRGGCRRLGLRD